MTRFLIIARACSAETDGAHLEAKLEHDLPPSPEELKGIREEVAGLYRTSFGAPPARVAVATLPWVDELDEPDVFRQAQEPEGASVLSVERAQEALRSVGS